MMIAKRSVTAAISCVLVVLMCFGAVAESVYSSHGAFAVRILDTVYAAVDTGSEYGLYGADAASATGAEMQLLSSAKDIDELVAHDTTLYFIQSDGTSQNIMSMAPDGTVTVLSEFEVGVTISDLSWYDDVLYVIANSRLYIVDPENGAAVLLSDELIDDYVIVDDVIYFVSASDTFTYDRPSPSDETVMISQTSGAVWSMSIGGENPARLIDKGATGLSSRGGYLYFHNLEDNYIIGSGDNLWLEGKLYRYNIETSQTSSMNIPYDWDYYPTDSGLVVYSSQDLSLYPLTGGTAKNLMSPGVTTNVTAEGAEAYVYEYDSQKLSLVPLDGSAIKVLSENGDIVTGEPILDENGNVIESKAVIATEATGEFTDQSYDEDTNTVLPGNADTYIFPNSSIKKLTREQIQMVDKSLWGYARNEIYARHGYVYNNGAYATYFKAKNWYKPGGFSSGSLSSIEWSNMELFKELEREAGTLSSSSSKSTTSKSGKNNYYILKEARSRKLTKKYIRNKLGSRSKYALARNEILARHGYVFKTAKYRKYFNNQAWYSPGGYSSSDLSNIEWYNIEQLKELEAGW